MGSIHCILLIKIHCLFVGGVEDKMVSFCCATFKPLVASLKRSDDAWLKLFLRFALHFHKSAAVGL